METVVYQGASTPDLGGNASTSEFARAVAEAIDVDARKHTGSVHADGSAAVALERSAASAGMKDGRRIALIHATTAAIDAAAEAITVAMPGRRSGTW